MKTRPLWILLLLLLFSIQFALPQAGEHTAQVIYLEGKKKTIDQEWDQAINAFNKVLAEHPHSKYVDESRFWIGYCYEKKDGQTKKAFDAYDAVAGNATSVWADDARLRQILIAEKLLPENEKYKIFLIEQLASANIQFRQLAAIALGKSGEGLSLPVLKQIPREEDLYSEAQLLIKELERDAKVKSPGRVVKPPKTGQNIIQTTPKVKSDPGPDGKKINYYAEKSLAQYQSLIRTDDNWNKQELLNFGLWHIVATDLFESYLAMDSTGRARFLREFWVTKDPTPVTEVNEAQIEFENRVFYAREHYSYYDGLAGHYYAPWDARGEIYIKYGKPGSVKINDYDEIWDYPQHDFLQLLIRKNVTNIFGRAIFLNPRLGKKIGPLVFDKKASYDLIYSPRFVFDYKHREKTIKNFKFSVNSGVPGLLLEYQMPASEFVLRDGNGEFYIDYLQTFVVYNHDFNRIMTTEQPKHITGTTKAALKKILISQVIKLELPAGQYYFTMQILDKESNKIAVYKQPLTIR
ncbi:MAG TPA: GWxTD domain-containing protein [bacterium]|nr:GWxTD domain-containing protein [bacterium]HPN46141.1 GWxTD domain-containing protein [bacterium]